MLQERLGVLILRRKIALEINIEEVMDEFKTFMSIKRRLKLKRF